MGAPLDTATWPAELRLLLACLRPDARPEALAQQQALLPQVDATRLLKLAELHRVGALLGHHLKQLPAGQALAPLLGALRQRHTANALRTLSNARDLLQLTDRLASRGVRALPIKGTALAQALYRDPALRQPGDIDLLVDAADVPVAHALLVAEGYTESVGYATLGARRQAWLLRQHKDIEFIRRGAAVQVVDLHWRLVRNAAVWDVPFDDLWQRGADTPVGPRVLRVLSREDRLLYLCAHGSFTCWYRLKWLADLPPLLEDPALDWPTVLLRARQTNTLKTLGVGLRVAEALLGVAPPSAAAPALALVSDADLALVSQALLSPESWWPGWWRPGELRRTPGFVLRYWRYQFQLGQGWRFRREYLESRLVSLNDVQAVALPRGFFVLYLLVRPVGWLVRALRAAKP